MPLHKPIVLVVLDGWGETDKVKGNPIAAANIPTIKKLNKFYPKILLQASGISVGLPWKENGNSEVGHQAMGSGRIIYQNLPQINLSIEDGSFFENKVLIDLIEQAKKSPPRLHIMGLLSDGAVHSHINHLFAIMELIKDRGLKDVFFHIFLDGRDTPPNSGLSYLQRLQDKMKALELGTIASISGRYYAMDRNKNWERTEKTLLAMTGDPQTKHQEKDPLQAVQKQYNNDIFDENIEPICIIDKDKKPIGSVKDNDLLLFTNFRKDRAKQITEAFVSPKFKEFKKLKQRPKKIHFVSMVEYDKNLKVNNIAFPPEEVKDPLGFVLAEKGKKQLRIAETEKYAHVTYFFNCGKDKPFAGEDHEMIPSKNTPSYDNEPEMSATEITDKLIEKINSSDYDFILVNYANPDMVGHTGNFDATLKAVETVDKCLERLIPVVLNKKGCLLITADHGNAEEVINPNTGEIDTEHSNNPVPLWFVSPSNHSDKNETINKNSSGISSGILCDITPTILELMKIEKIETMSCNSLLPILKRD